MRVSDMGMIAYLRKFFNPYFTTFIRYELLFPYYVPR
jgi:hypothetical protein